MADKVDVVADLRGVVRIAKAASSGVTGNSPRIERAERAVDAVVTLIAERDEANRQLDLYRAAINRLDDLTEYARESVTRKELVDLFTNLTADLAGRGGAA